MSNVITSFNDKRAAQITRAADAKKAEKAIAEKNRRILAKSGLVKP